MKYAPGSFSKNFGWHGKGLRKLHIAIQSGFQNNLAPVNRQNFRDNSDLDASLSLIPVNFFLHNCASQISVDELVFHAIEYPHSDCFDRLGLFALHLNRAGSGKRVNERPTMWANEFVRECLWSGNSWQSSALSDASLDSFIENRMDAQDDVRLKCRNNYRHLFELCKFWPSSISLINSDAEQWIAPALFLTWDRHILNGGQDDKDSLLELINSDEIYKLLGVTQEFTNERASHFVDLYIDIGCLARFLVEKKLHEDKATTATTKFDVRKLSELPEGEGLDWLKQEESDQVVERRSVERQEQKRDRKKAAVLKQHYDNRCMFCGTRLQVSENNFYSEAAHIRGLGEPHNGPDNVSNMLVLCPNHHLQFDRGMLRLSKDGDGFRIESKIIDDSLDGKVIYLKHFVDDNHIQYHHYWHK